MKIYGIDKAAFNQGRNAQFGFSITEEQSTTLVAKCPNGVGITKNARCNRFSMFGGLQGCEQSGGRPVEVHRRERERERDEDMADYAVRRLTPTECERLQGFPDGWTDIGDWTDSKGKIHKGGSDLPRYKALGNSIAVGFTNGQNGYWCRMFRRMAEFLPENATLGSLFDGIGGFPLAWETVHGKGTARWASEIEEFPITATKIRFPEEER